MKSLYEELGGTYRQVGDYLIPDIELPERNYEIGKYGRMRRRYLKEIMEAEIGSLGVSLHAYGFQICAYCVIAELDPFRDGHSVGVAYIVDPFLRVLLQQDLNKAAQILHMLELQLHTAITGDVEPPSSFGTLKDERLPVHILHGAVQIWRTQDKGMRNCLPQIFLRSQLVGAIGTPMDVGTAGLFLCKGLGIGFWVNGGRGNHDVISEFAQSIHQILHVLLGVGSDVQHCIKFIAFQLITQIIPVTFDQSYIGKLGLGIAIQDIHNIALLGKVIGDKTADKHRAAGDKNSSHDDSPLAHNLIHYIMLKRQCECQILFRKKVKPEFLPTRVSSMS